MIGDKFYTEVWILLKNGVKTIWWSEQNWAAAPYEDTPGPRSMQNPNVSQSARFPPFSSNFFTLTNFNVWQKILIEFVYGNCYFWRRNSFFFQQIDFCFKKLTFVSKNWLLFQKIHFCFKKFTFASKNSLLFQKIHFCFTKFISVSKNSFLFQKIHFCLKKIHFCFKKIHFCFKNVFKKCIISKCFIIN